MPALEITVDNILLPDLPMYLLLYIDPSPISDESHLCKEESPGLFSLSWYREGSSLSLLISAAPV